MLKSSGKSASEIAEIFDVTVPTVYACIKRYKENGIKGLETRPGQGRKPIMDCSDEEAVRKAIEECSTPDTYIPHSDSEAKDERQESPKVEGPSQQVLDSIVYTWTCVPVVMH